jgi:diguanylate cyclase
MDERPAPLAAPPADTPANPHATHELLVERTHAQVDRLLALIEHSGGHARDYAAALRTGRATLGAETPLIEDLLAATALMLERTEALEAQLTASAAEVTRLRADVDHALAESRTDALTGLPNRKAFAACLAAHAADPEAAPLSLLFCDIDHFKRFNDSWGHRLGDEVLRLVGMSLDRHTRGHGLAARYGGEEFVVVLPRHDRAAAARLAETLRGFVASRVVRARQTNRDVGRITMSLGVAERRPNEPPDHLIERADAALYRAKDAGRNRVEVAG